MIDALDSEGPPFEFVDTEHITFACRSRGRDPTETELEVTDVAIFEPHDSVKRARGQRGWTEIVYSETYGIYLTRHALEQRLGDSRSRESDYKALQKNLNAKPIELWDRRGTLVSTPTHLFSVDSTEPYDDEVDEDQLDRWKNLAIKLGKPPKRINLNQLRFRLKPFGTLKTKKDLLYCTPAKPPVFDVNVKMLKTIIKNNTGDFNGWPDPLVITYAEAERKGLKLVGRNFLQFYFIWMTTDDYRQLWAWFQVYTNLLHPFPVRNDEAVYKEIDKMLKQSRGGRAVDGTPTEISSKKIGARHRGTQGKPTLSVMGKSATILADKLLGKHCMTSGMGNSKFEWLHRVAYGLGGPDAFKNLVFGTWECNTDMIRVESMVKALTKKGEDGFHCEGRLTTVNNTTGPIDRFTLEKTNTTSTVPSWAKKYSWLCFSLTYRYEMDAFDSPLGEAIVAEIKLDPWSLYVPLSIEPKLDSEIVGYLTSSKATANVGAQDMKRLSLTSDAGDPDSPANLPLPEYDSDEYSTLAWNTALNGLPSLELPGIFVKCPTIARGPLHDGVMAYSPILTDTPVPQSGFVLQGEVSLFGTDVVGMLEKWMGPAPEDVVVGINPPSIERVVIPDDFHMSMLIPLLRDTPFDKIILRNVAIYHQNYLFDKTKTVGWHFNADWVIDSSCGLLHDILTKALQVHEPILSIHTALGKGLCWDGSLNLHSFILQGVFSKLTLSPVSGLTLTSIGVRLLGIRGFSFVPEPHSTLSFGFGIFGTMKLDVPGAVLPLDLDYEMGLVGNTVNLRAELSGSIWRNALGVKGLMLDDVVFGTTFSTTSLWDSFAFDVSAKFSYPGSQAYLQGTYAAGGHFSLTAELDDFGIDEIDDMFSGLFSDSLILPAYDVHVGSAIVSIVSGQGLSMSLLDVRVAGNTAASLEVAFSSSGASLSGKLSSSAITFGDVQLRDALIKLSFWTAGQKRKVDLMLGGKLKVDFLDLEVGAVVHLYPDQGKVEWAVVAELSAPGQPFGISDVVPALKGTFVDFSLRNAVIIAASQDDPLINQSFPSYPVRKGVQVFAVIERIQALDDLLHEKVTGLVLNAGWSKGSGFNLMISLPAESSIDLGNGIKTTPITLGIRTSPIELAISAGIKVPVKDSTPLDFSFILAANVTGASVSAQMEGWWVKPFGVENLKIGPEVTLSIEIVYATFVATGLPSGFGVSGGLMIGSIKAFLAFNISEDPKRQLLYGEVKKLDISDVVEFAGTLVQQDIPKIPDNLLKFEELKVYVCPFGVVLGKTVYPQGFSFKADLLVFEKRANIECTIDKAQKSVDIVGGIDNFELGPLTVRGSKGPRATLECHVGVSKQQLIVDGVVSIFDAQAQTYINIQFLPDPKFKFYLMLEWADIFMFKLDAELLGSIRDKLSEADFSFYAELENNILEYIAQQIVEQFEAAKVAATEGLEAAQKKVDDAKKDWERAIADAEKKLDDAQKTWESYEQDIRSSSQPVIDNYLSEITRLQGEIDNARKAYESALDDAERAVNQANQDRGAALASAQCDVENARQAMNSAIDDAQRKLDDAKSESSRAFGDAQRDIDSAQRDVDSIQNEIDNTKRTIREYEDASGWEFWKKAAIPGLWAYVGILEGSKAVATAALDVARAVLKGAEYVAKEGAVELASKALDLARATGQAGLTIAEGALRVADETSKAAVDAAAATLEGVKQGGKYVAFESAKGALEAFKQANKAAYEVAMVAIKGLMDSAAFVAFNATKAGLEVAKGSTKVLDAAKGALVIVEKASQAALSILQEVVKWAAKAVNIKTIILSGTLRGVLGIGGSTARPLKAVVKGYVVGQSFDIEAEFDPRKPVEFITALFKQLWDLVSNAFKPGMLATSGEQHHIVKRGVMAMEVVIQPGQLLAASSRFLQRRPDVLKMLTDVSASFPADIPRGPFSGRPIVPSVVVARKALILMQEEMGMSVLEDLDGAQG